MGKKRPSSSSATDGSGEAHTGDVRSPAPAGYAQLLREIKDRIQQSRTRAIFSLNAEMMRLYWDIGRMIDRRQRHEGGQRLFPGWPVNFIMNCRRRKATPSATSSGCWLSIAPTAIRRQLCHSLWHNWPTPRKCDGP